MPLASNGTSPCAACKLLRRRCAPECVFAPHFPAEQPHKFAIVHRVFGASNTNKMLQDLAPEQREDAVSSLVYEAEARFRDPVYGCVAAIASLQQQVAELQVQLAQAQAETVYARLHHHSRAAAAAAPAGGGPAAMAMAVAATTSKASCGASVAVAPAAAITTAAAAAGGCTTTTTTTTTSSPNNHNDTDHGATSNALLLPPPAPLMALPLATMDALPLSSMPQQQQQQHGCTSAAATNLRTCNCGRCEQQLQQQQREEERHQLVVCTTMEDAAMPAAGCCSDMDRDTKDGLLHPVSLSVARNNFLLAPQAASPFSVDSVMEFGDMDSSFNSINQMSPPTPPGSPDLLSPFSKPIFQSFALGTALW